MIMLISELSKRTGLSIHTLRYYENYGLFHGVTDEKVTSNNYKNYKEGDVARIEIIKGAKLAGFSLAEIKDLIESWYGKQLPMENKVEVVRNKLLEIEAKIQQLEEVKKILQKAMKDIEKGDC